MKRISLLAFFVGNLCDILLYIAGAAALMMYTHARVRHPGMSPQDIRSASIALRAHGTLRTISYSISPLAAVLAGFVGGTFGQLDPLLNGILSTALTTCLGILIIATHSSRDPVAIQLGLLVLGVGAAALDGFLARTRAAS